MDQPINVRLLNPANPDWPDQVEALRSLAGAPGNPLVFPSHFLRVVLPRIGGHALVFERDRQPVAAGFLLPRALEADRRVFTLRLHIAQPGAPVDDLAAAVEHVLPDARVIPYDPAAFHSFEPTSLEVDGWDIGSPSGDEAMAIRDLQAQIWGQSADNLYPTDIHSPDFGSVQSEVVRSGGQVVAFLFGFYKFGERPLPPAWRDRVRGDWRLESQVLGVRPGLRGHGLATLLKARQAERTRWAGIDIINWTADPLLWPNAVLNFGRLGALAFDFTANMYAFRNAMNRAPASRLALTWLVSSRRVDEHLRAPRGIPGLAETGAVAVNSGAGRADFGVDGPRIAVEIPPDWVALQEESLENALVWRETTDKLLSHYLGAQLGRYVVTGVARDLGRCYLLADRVADELLDALVASSDT